MTTKIFKLDDQLKQDCFTIVDLDLCKVLLMNESQFPWVILVPCYPDITEICQLNDEQQFQLQTESNLISEILLNQYPNCTLNIAKLGNIVSQLHIHHIVRFSGDASWPAPIWGNYKAKPYLLAEIDEKITFWQSRLA